MKIHIIAVGGAAMHQLAIALRLQGHEVTGSDDEIRDPACSNLEKHGLMPDTLGWNPERIHRQLDMVITGMHARKDNPELERAIKLGIKVFSMPEYVYETSKAKTRIVIGGSHGKTTITAMIMHVLKTCGMDFDYLVGSAVRGFSQMVRLSDSAQVIVIEGDEYLTSPLDPRPKFHVYRPDIGVISGIAWDHINVFPTFENYLEQFRIFAALIPNNGKLFACGEDQNVKQLITEFGNRREFALYDSFPHTIKDGTYYLTYKGMNFPLHVFGDHNMQNISAAYHVCSSLGITDESFINAICEFEGAARRLELLAKNDGITVYRDFAHSPSKLKATVCAMKAKDPDAQIIAIYELHTFSSLNKDFLPQYEGTMEKADVAVVYYNPQTFAHKKLEVFGEKEIHEAFAKNGMMVSDKAEEISSFVIDKLNKKTNILLMSSGNFTGWNLELFLNMIFGKIY